MIGLRFLGEWSAWIGVPLALALGAGLWFLYRRETASRHDRMRWILPTLRGAALAMLILTLVGPTLHRRWVEGQFAKVMVFVDATRSMAVTDPSMTPGRKMVAAMRLGWIPPKMVPQDLMQAKLRLEDSLSQVWTIRGDSVSDADREAGLASLVKDADEAGKRLDGMDADAMYAALSKRGVALCEYWENIGGGNVDDLKRNDAYKQNRPNGSFEVAVVEGKQNWKDNFGTRISGYLHPPLTGEYTFWIAGRENVRLGLSTDASPAKCQDLVNLGGDFKPREWEKDAPKQRSKPVRLEAGKRYYFELLQKAGGGDDHLEAGWRLPDGTMDRPISGDYLSLPLARATADSAKDSFEALRQEFRDKLLEPARSLRVSPTERTAFAESLRPVSEQLSMWKQRFEAAIDDVAGALATSEQEGIGDALRRFDELSRWRRAQTLLLEGEKPLLSELATRHNVELYTFNDTSAEQVWRGTVGRTDSSSVLPAALPGDPSAIATNESIPLQTLLAQAGGGEETDAEKAKTAKSKKQGQQLAAIVLTDGRHNRGESPIELSKVCGARGVPVFTVGMGSERKGGDMAVLRVDAPQMVRAKDRLKGRVQLNDGIAPGRPFFLRIMCDGKKIWEQSLVTQNSSERMVDFDIPLEDFIKEKMAKQPADMAYRSLPLELTAVVEGLDEVDREPENNKRDFYTRAVFRKFRLLLLDGRPRWEYRYINNMFQRDEKWEVTTFLFDPTSDSAGARKQEGEGFPKDEQTLFTYDLVVIGDFPPEVLYDREMEWIVDFVNVYGGGVVFIDGQRGNLQRFEKTPLGKLLPVKWKAQADAKEGLASALKLTDAGNLRLTQQGTKMAALTLAGKGEDNAVVWSKLKPPHFVAPVEELQGTEVLLEAELAGKSSPALVFRTYGVGHVLYSAFDESWRWRYRVGDEYHERYWNQVTGLMMVRPYAVSDKVSSIDVSALTYATGERAPIRAQLRDKDGKPFTKTAAKAHIYRDGTKVMTIPLDAVPDLHEFQGITAPLENGRYEIRLEATGYSEAEMKTRLPFFVETPETGELSDISCDGNLLRQVAENSQGAYYPEENARDLVDRLQPFSRGRVIEKETPLWDGYGWLSAIVILLTADWLLRKRAGMM